MGVVGDVVRDGCGLGLGAGEALELEVLLILVLEDGERNAALGIACGRPAIGSEERR